MPSLAAVLLVVPLVWPTRFVGPDATCFSPEDDPKPTLVAPPSPPAVPVDAIPAPPEPPAPPDPALRSPVAVAVWGEIALVTIPVEDAI